MRKIFNVVYIAGMEWLFWLFIVLMIAIILLTLYFVLKEVKHESK
jgi:hypothetical protein